MNALEAYEKYKHFDQILSDKEWMLPDGKSDSDKLARQMNSICYDLWQAVKDATALAKRARRDDSAEAEWRAE